MGWIYDFLNPHAVSLKVAHPEMLKAITAALAAYRDSRDWHLALIDYLRKNRDLAERAIGEMPGVSMHHVESTYLAWIDARQTGMENPVQGFEEAGVGLSDGKSFGLEGYVRLNFGCPRPLLEEALDRMLKVTNR